MADEKKQENTGIVEYESNGEIVKNFPNNGKKVPCKRWWKRIGSGSNDVYVSLQISAS